ncbi:MAG: GDP-mannose 4,6-dehydratase [Lachnospiraceae bacterium]|nr:GDP-mannose 4,6-dehydratase [Lachnospiraceae bacterium]
MKRVLITGGCGFIGTNLAAKLLEEGNFVIALDNLYCADKENAELFADNPNYLFVNRDVREPFDDIVADEIYHLAAPASPAVYMQDTVYTIETIVNGTVNALNCARTNNSRLIIASTSEIYGESLIHPQDEEYNGNVRTMCLRACYDEAKRCAETYAYCYFKQYGINVSIARLFNTYGPYMRLKDGRVVTSFIESYLNHDALHINGNGKQTRSFCYIDDLLKGLISYMQSSIVGEAINLGNDTEIDINTLAAIFMDISGNKLEIEYRSSVQNEPRERQPDLTKARKLLGYDYSIPVQEGLRSTLRYFKEKFESTNK